MSVSAGTGKRSASALGCLIKERTIYWARPTTIMHISPSATESQLTIGIISTYSRRLGNKQALDTAVSVQHETTASCRVLLIGLTMVLHGDKEMHWMTQGKEALSTRNPSRTPTQSRIAQVRKDLRDHRVQLQPNHTTLKSSKNIRGRREMFSPMNVIPLNTFKRNLLAQLQQHPG